MGPDDTNASSTGTSKGYTVPKLARDGSNWVTWKSRMLAILVSTRGIMWHIEGTACMPAPLPTDPANHHYTELEEEELEKKEKRWDHYHQHEAMVKAQIFTTIPEGLLVKVQKLHTAKEIWDAVCGKHEAKGLMVQVDIRRCMQELKCQEDADVCAHLDNLMRMHEELSGMNAAPDSREFLTIMLRSLLKSYGPLLNAITIATSTANAQLDPDNIATLVTQEYDRWTIEQHQLQSNKNALATKLHGKNHHLRKMSTSANSSSEIECWKCR